MGGKVEREDQTAFPPPPPPFFCRGKLEGFIGKKLPPVFTYGLLIFFAVLCFSKCTVKKKTQLQRLLPNNFVHAILRAFPKNVLKQTFDF